MVLLKFRDFNHARENDLLVNCGSDDFKINQRFFYFQREFSFQGHSVSWMCSCWYFNLWKLCRRHHRLYVAPAVL